MKKLMLVMLFILLMVGWMAAQTYIPQTDVLGAHNNGGRGCAACHAPHSGGRGNGGDIVGTGSGAPAGLNEGDYHLWGQDMYLITQETLQFGGGYDNGGAGYTVNFNGGVGTEWFVTSSPSIASIASCLSCHDGNVSKGAMMLNQSYEQLAGLLPNGNGSYATNKALYGTAPIPTLLGNDGTTPGNYKNDHPVGQNANISAGNGLVWANNQFTVTPGTPYAQFVANYGWPALAPGKWSNPYGVTAGGKAYVLCTTCHNQHVMTVYTSSKASPIAGDGGGKYYATYFFINGPYNPNINNVANTNAPSTTQFCRQCHFGESNEANNTNNITTVFQ